MTTWSLHFSTHAHLKNLIGKDLINDDNIAIIELVKNAYDAGSTVVEVHFEKFVNEATDLASRILICDTGCGMSIDDLTDKWLNIAYSEKKQIRQAPGAYLAGNKGVGRFSCDRLGARVDLYTRRASGQLIHVPVDWTAFEAEERVDTTIQSVELVATVVDERIVSQATGLGPFPDHGTVLLISRLRSRWDRPKLLNLRRTLEKFLDPNQLFAKARFRVHLVAPDFAVKDNMHQQAERIHGEIENQIFEKLQFNTTYIEVDVDAARGTVETALFHDGQPVYRFAEKSDIYPLIKKARVVIYYLNQYKKAYFKRQTGVRVLDFGSVFLFLNGFRVAPYGDRGDDWLKLDNQKNQGWGRNLGTREVVGRVEILDDDTDHFVPVSSREGLKNTDAFVQLKEGFVHDAVSRLERFVVDGLSWDSVPLDVKRKLAAEPDLDWTETAEQLEESWERKKHRIGPALLTLIGLSAKRIQKMWFNVNLLEGLTETRGDDVAKLLMKLEALQPGQLDQGLKHGLSRVRRILEEKQKEVEVANAVVGELATQVDAGAGEIAKLTAEKDRYRAQTLFLKSVASQDVKSLLTYHHQIKIDSDIIDNCLRRVGAALQSENGDEDARKWLGKASMANRRISVVAQFATRANFANAARRVATDLPAYFDQYLTTIAPSFSATGLQMHVQNNVHELFEVRVSRIELSILIDNLIINARKANARSLWVDIQLISADTLEISFRDDGTGLSSAISRVESVFEFGVTTTAGSGLGLFHAREIVDKLGGKIEAQPVLPHGFKIRIEVTR